MKTIKYLLIFLATTCSISSVAETLYVSDDIHVYLHSGPSVEYRIIGTLKAGTKVTTLKHDKKAKFIQIKTPRGKVAWMKQAELQNSLPAKILLPTVQEELEATKSKLADIASENSKNNEEKERLFQEQLELVSHLNQEKTILQKEILDLKARNLELDLLQETKDSSIKMQWLLNGGGVLFLGLLIGLLIPFLPRRKKRTNNW